MLYTETVKAGTLDLIKRFMDDEEFKEFRLVGGTALSLYIGHRISIDIDLFCNTDFNAVKISKHLNSTYKGAKTQALKNATFSLVNNIKVDLIAHQYPWLKPSNNIDDIRMASLDDIGAMKVHAIIQSGNRLKDFIDVYFLLEHRSFSQLINVYEQKYPDANRILAHNAMVYFKDIDFDAPVKLINSMHWDRIAARLMKASRNKETIFKPDTAQKPS
jgi:hypothetical protein